MSLSMSSASLPVFTSMLGNLRRILDKGLAHAEARKFDPLVLTSYRLAPDMLPFTRQVLIACDAARLGVARIGGIDPGRWEDKETSFEELKARIDRTVEWLAAVKPEQLDGTEDKEVTFPVGRESTRTMKAEAFLKHWVLPNFYFHVTTAYAILRHNGVELGKADYLGGR
ncbi:DUF1993 domain-containing protein [Ramlibacter rhizophilus]|uniref:DUF1993 domain-containing protein n=1 Tax=Ramlibacter rhizophilus TaxID=1781167 RepID=A0A4Z0C2M2_9BURK|nr:DUF1993 domain-containing protein [Ramlibacter rhizophilus]TFZ04758.1 DUF1993 domain-containing protein [Ramlibacter rhizophilus]